jgi:hypothetical protein
MMNRYGAMAQGHWRQRLPGRYQQIPDPGEYFSALGEQMSQAVADLAADLAGQDPPGETYLDKTGRLEAARRQAEEIVLSEVLPDPEAQAGEDPAESLARSMEAGSLIPPVVLPGGPAWDQVSETREALGLDG